MKIKHILAKPGCPVYLLRFNKFYKRLPLQTLEKNSQGFLCNLGTGRGSSVLEVVAAFEKVTGKKIPYEFADRRCGDVPEAWANPLLAEKVLGWKTSRSLEEMLRDAWHWQSKNPKGYGS